MTAAPPRFLDTYRASTAPTTQSWDGFPPAVPGASFGGLHGNAAHQVRRYRYWTYIAIDRIASRASDPFPNFGVPTRGNQQQHLTRREQRYLRQAYGSRVLQSESDDLEPVGDTHPIVEMFQRVNDGDTFADLIYETVVQLRLTGLWYWWLIPDASGMPTEIHVLPTSWVTPHYDSRTGQLLHYKVQAENGNVDEIPPEEIVVGRQRHPASKTEGWSAIEAAPLWDLNTEEIERTRHKSLRRGIFPSFFLEAALPGKDGGHGKLTGDDQRMLRTWWQQEYGGGENAGGPILLPPGVKPHAATTSPREMDFGESSDRMRDNILALHGCPPVVAGVTSDYTRATADAANLVFCENTINPLLTKIAGVITEKIAPRFDPRIRCWYPDCRPDNAEHRLAELQAASQNGAFFPDEWRAELGLEPKGTPQYETGYLSQGLVPLDEDAFPDPLPAADEDADEPEPDETPEPNDAADEEE